MLPPMSRAAPCPTSMLSLLALWCAGCGAGGAGDPAARPNILLVTIESLRPDHLSLYGYSRETTPNLRALAGSATVYDNAFSVTSWTLASHASIFTGLYPTAHDTVRPRDRLKDSYVTLAEALAAAGYQTAGIVSGEYLKPQFNLHQGFEHYDDSPARERRAPRRGGVAEAAGEPASRATNPDMEAAVGRFLGASRDPARPFFLFLYYWDPHYPYLPPAPHDQTFVPEGARPPRQRVRFQKGFELNRHVTPEEMLFVEAQYDGEIRATDESLARIVEMLAEGGLLERTALIVTADHGEQFFDHGSLGHKHSLYDEEVHVPLLFKRPGQQEGRRDPRLVSLVDLYPTVLDLAGLGGTRLSHGRSLLEPPRPPGEPIYHELKALWYLSPEEGGGADESDVTALRQGDLKAILAEKSGELELFDVAADQGERRPLAAAGERERLVERIRSWREALREIAAEGGPPERAALDAEDVERLRELGYVR